MAGTQVLRGSYSDAAGQPDWQRMEEILSRIQSPADIKTLSMTELETLAQEIRERLIVGVAKTGGHIGPNLGVVELTIAMHYVFDTPQGQFCVRREPPGLCA